MTVETVDLATLDVIYLTYNEPQKEVFWAKIQNMIPWATRVDGVKGSDAAHKAAAAASTTDRFILIDGDNLPDMSFFDHHLVLDDSNRDCVFRWKAYNHVNGLRYGNGGLSCWTKDFVNNMRTHEASDGSDDTSVEFCFDPKYIAMHDTFSTTYVNYDAEQAWRAGFREGVKMCLNKGTKPNLKEFEQRVHARNYDNLCVWMSVGADATYGNWTRAGAILGTAFTMLDHHTEFLPSWDYRDVQDFDSLSELWAIVQDTENPIDTINHRAPLLKRKLNLPIANMTAEDSAFFKHHMSQQHRNVGVMVTEMEVIRRLEGW